MRYGALCKALHVLPRSGGLLEQEAGDIIRLEAIIDAFNRYEDHLAKKSNTRDKNRQRIEKSEVQERMIEQ